MEWFGIFVGAVVMLVLIFIVLGVKSVPQSQEWTVERFGKYTGTLGPGLHLIVPVIDQIGMKLDKREVVLDVPSQEVITKDNATVTVDGVVFYQIVDAARAAYEVADLVTSTLNLAMTNTRTVIGSMDLDEVLSRRDDINERLLRIVDEATQPWGVKVTRIEIKDLSPPEDMVASMARQMKAERERRAVILEAEGLREAAIKRAEGEKQAAILQAEGRLEAARREAEARERLAEAEAKATSLVSEAIASGNTSAINYFVAQKYIEALAGFAASPNQKLLVLPVEATGVIGSIAGIAEIAREALGRGAPGGGAPATQTGTTETRPGPWTPSAS